MNIALFTETYLPYINGVVTHVKSLKEGLEKLGHKVLVVAADPHARHHYVRDGVLNCPAITSKKIYEYGVASPVSYKRLKMLKEFNPDIIHIHNEFGVGLSGITYSNLLNVPLVYTLHTMYDEYLYYVTPAPLMPIAKRIAHGYTKIFARNAAGLTGPSAKVEEFFKEVGIDKKVYVIPNPVEIDAFNLNNIKEEDVQAVKKKYNIKEDETLFCFCGRLGKEKSVDLLIEYWAQCFKDRDDLKLMIIGDGPIRPEYEELAKNLGISNKIIFTGAVDHSKLPPYYACCQVYITASLSDTNSISMKEGMAMGLLVCSRLDPLNEGQVVDGVNGFNFKDADEMKQKIENYLALDTEEKDELKYRVINQMLSADCLGLANHIVPIYERLIRENSYN